MSETQLWGRAKDSEEWQEELLLSDATPEQIERVKVLAAAQGFHSFRVSTFSFADEMPDFTKVLNTRKRSR